jgi:hypothetical protein
LFKNSRLYIDQLLKAGIHAEVIGEVYENDQRGLLEIL